MGEGVYIAAIGLLASALVATIAWLRFHNKDRVETEAQKQVALSERFDDANQLTQYIQTQIENAVAPLRTEIENLKKASHRIHDAFRSFFTQLWIWDRDGRSGKMPAVPKDILAELRLGHFLDMEFEDTEPLKEATHE
jgi:uncharacterized protein YdcH (DUF465 family)